MNKLDQINELVKRANRFLELANDSIAQANKLFKQAADLAGTDDKLKLTVIEGGKSEADKK